MKQGTAIVCDPALIVSTGASDLSAFWSRFSEWTADRRLILASHTYRAVIEWCSQEIWDSASTAIPEHLRREVTSQINRFMSRPPVDHPEPLADHPSHPLHIACGGTMGAPMMSDLIGLTTTRPVAGLGTSTEFWSHAEKTLDVDNLEKEILLIFKPNEPTAADIDAQIKTFYSGTTILIVGGKKDPKIISEVESVCGVPQKDVQWIESELNKSPRELPARLKAFSGVDSHIVFIYGRVGHDSFEHIQKAASKAKYQLIQPEHESRIVAEMTSRAIETELPSNPL